MKRQYTSPIIETTSLTDSIKPLATSTTSDNRITYGGSNLNANHDEADSQHFWGALTFDNTEEENQ